MFLPKRHSHKGIGSPEPRLFLVLRKRFGKGGGGSAPPAVDPARVAEVQAQANIATANRQAEINNVRTTSPFGKSFFEEGPDGRWNLDQSLSPELQPVFDQATGLAKTLSGYAGNAALEASSAVTPGASLIKNAWNYLGSQLPVGPTDISGLPTLQATTPTAGGLVSGVERPRYDNLTPLSPGAGLQSRLDFTGLTGLPSSATDFSNEVGQAQDAAYRTQSRYLDPQYTQKRGDLRQQLADQGIPVGSEAYTRATGDLDRAENFAYGGARDAATLAGNEEQARLFGENLSSRQQGVGERSAQGAFTNAAQAQGFGQSQAAGQYQLQTIAQKYAQDLQAAALNNSAQQQTFGQGLTGNEFANQARQQAFNEAITRWAQPLTALGQQAGIGSSILGSTSGVLSGLQPFSDFGFGGNIPTFGSQGTVVPATNVVGAQNSANNAAAARFAAQNTQSNQLFNGLGSLGGALGFGNGGLGNALGIGGSGGLFGGGSVSAIGADPSLSSILTGEPSLDSILTSPFSIAGGIWIVCTELMRQGRMPKRHWIAGSPVFAKYPEMVKRGYYIWAIPSVHHLRKRPDSLYSKTLAKVFGWRAENIAAKAGVPGARKRLRGAAVTAVLWPICAALGSLIREQDWRSVYGAHREMEVG